MTAARRHDIALPVALAEGESATEVVRGTICLPPSGVPEEAQLLLHGATYDSWYWDPVDVDAARSYVRAAADAGQVTVNIDRVGSGRSSRPDPALLDTAAHAHVAHQVVQALLGGGLDVAFERVMLTGHSYGSVIAMLAAARYQDVTALLLTGFWHRFAPGFERFANGLRPAADEGGRHGDLPHGYLTTPRGTRAALHQPFADADVVDVDELHKGVHTAAELATAAGAVAASRQVTVPVLLIVGAHDTFFDLADSRDLLRQEWPRTRAQLATVPAGHSLALSPAAGDVFRLACEWTGRDDDGRRAAFTDH